MKCPNCGTEFLPLKESEEIIFKTPKEKQKKESNQVLEELPQLKHSKKVKPKKGNKQKCKNCGILLNTTEQPNLVNLKEVKVSVIQPEHCKDGKKDPSLGKKRR